MCDCYISDDDLMKGINGTTLCIRYIRNIIKIFQQLYHKVGHNMVIIIMSYTEYGILTSGDFHRAKYNSFCTPFWSDNCLFTSVVCLHLHASRINDDYSKDDGKGGEYCLYNHPCDNHPVEDPSSLGYSSDSSDSSSSYEYPPALIERCGSCGNLLCVCRENNSESDEDQSYYNSFT